MTLDEVKKMAADLEMFGPDGLGDGSRAVEFGQAVLNLVDLAEACEQLGLNYRTRLVGEVERNT